MEDKSNNIFKYLKLTKKELFVFMANMILVFVMVTLQHLHLQPPQLFKSFQEMVSPVPAKLNIFDQILPKLEQTKNSYQLKKATSWIPDAQAEGDYAQASAYAVIDYDTGEIISSKNIHQQLPIASLTKIMSAVVALDLAKPSDLFSVEPDVNQIVPTKINVQPGEKFTLQELLTAALLTSANDSVQVIKDGVNSLYQNQIFVEAMNAKAHYLDLGDSHFTNPQGFDYGNPYSSVADLAVLTHYALSNYPLIDDLVQKQEDSLPQTSTHQEYDKLYNWNGLLGVYPGVYGVKIGNTAAAKMTTIVISQRAGKRIMAIVLGAPGILDRDLWASELLDLGFSKEANLPPVNVTREQLLAKYQSWY